MDQTIRELQRRAAGGSAEDQRALERALQRLGRDALRYTGPAPAPAQPYRGSRQLDRAEAAAAAWTGWSWAPRTRRQAAARAFTKREGRRAARRARKHSLRDWEPDD